MRRGWCSAIALFGALAAFDPALADSAGPTDKTIPTIVVTGEAQQQVDPDTAVVTLGVATERPTAREASSVNAATMRPVIDAAKAAGIAERDIATAQTTLTPVYDTPVNGQAPRIKGFRAVNTVVIQVHKIDSAGDLVGRLIDRGANSLEGIDFKVADLTPARDALYAQATLDARHRAEIYASALGLKLGRVLSITPEGGVAEPMPPRAFRMAAAPAPVPLQAGTQTVDARVTVTWVLDGQP